jgi:hypothetical protein
LPDGRDRKSGPHRDGSHHSPYAHDNPYLRCDYGAPAGADNTRIARPRTPRRAQDAVPAPPR